MTADSSHPQLHLQVVPPTNRPDSNPAPPAQASKPDKEPPVAPESGTPPYQRWLIMSGLGLGLGAISFIAIPNHVQGSVEVESTAGARDFVYMQISGTIQELLVQANATVEPNQPVARLNSDELEQEIAEAKIAQEQARSILEAKQQQLPMAQARLNEALVTETASRQQTERLQREFAQTAGGTPPPQIRELENEITGIKSEIVGLKDNLQIVESTISDYQAAVPDGAIARNVLRDAERQQATLQSTIATKESQVRAKVEQIATIQKNLQEELEQLQSEVSRKVAARQSAQQEVEAVAADIQTQRRLEETLGEEFKRQQDKQQHLMLRAKQGGTVITDSLDQLRAKKLQAGDPVLEVVNLKQLTANVKIRQEDSDLVQKGALVKFRPREAGIRDYTATVQAIAPVVQLDESRQKRMLTVRILIDNDDNRLRPGVTGDARIETESIPIYQKLQREFLKLVPIGKFF